MLILDKPHLFESETVSIPLYHRGHLSLFEGAKVWLCLLPALQEGQFSEIVISPIHNESWSDLWRISITLRDRVGLVHDIFSILADRDINIITSESSSREKQSLHSIELIVNAQEYISPYNDSTQEERSIGKIEKLTDLRREILANLINDIAFLPTGQPRLRIRRVRHLLNARRDYINTKIHGGPSKAVVRETTVNKIGKDVTITLPEQVKKNLFEMLGVTKISKNNPGGHYLMVSNTTDRFLSIYFVKKTDAVIAPTIEHQHEIGALAAITDALGRAGFNILTSLSRLYRWDSQALTEFVLLPPPELRGVSDHKVIEARLESALRTPELIGIYKLKISYPQNYRFPLKTRRLTLPRSSRKKPAGLTDTSAPARSRMIESILNSHSRELAQRIRQGDALADDILRHKLAQDLIAQQRAIVKAERSGLRHSLFISYNFRDVDLKDRVSQEAEKHQFNVLTAEELGAAARNRDGIIQLISLCTHFLGIWTEEGGHELKADGSYLPSPWLHWEWGVADALGKRVRLLISEKLNDDAWERIAKETPQVIFKTVNFENKLKSALRSLSKMIA